ncbi:MAG: BrnT family toxin [Dehalococcoidia bacterium]|nr:BrnT family toxin [Dehalococcoidia bacterium]
MVFIEALEIDDNTLEKIETKHDITFQEVEEACFSEERHVRKSREGLYKVFSQTQAGRFVLVVLVNRGAGVWKVVTARHMTDSERRLYAKERRG